jgi:hypothetical protein
MDFIILIPVFVTGVLTKLADLIADDNLEIRKAFSYLIGIVYGVAIAYIISTHPLLAPIGLAAVLAVLLTKKIDRKPHNIGIASMFLFLGIWGFPKIDIVMISIFLASGLIDEIGNDRVDEGRMRGIPRRIFEYRLVFEITAFLVSLLTGEWVIFLGMLSFDAGYLLTKRTGQRFADAFGKFDSVIGRIGRAAASFIY